MKYPTAGDVCCSVGLPSGSSPCTEMTVLGWLSDSRVTMMAILWLGNGDRDSLRWLWVTVTDKMKKVL